MTFENYMVIPHVSAYFLDVVVVDAAVVYTPFAGGLKPTRCIRLMASIEILTWRQIVFFYNVFSFLLCH